MSTFTEVMRDVEIPAHLQADAEVPVHSGKPIRQGDVIVLPQRKGKIANLTQVPLEGIVVVRGEAGGNTHRLVADGAVLWAPNTTDRAIQGSLVVEEGATAFLTHEEHGAQGIGPGHYIVRRQVEQAEELRVVAD